MKIINLSSVIVFYIYIYVGDERTPEPYLWNFGKTPWYCNLDSTIAVLRNCCHSIWLYLFEIYDSELGLEATTGRRT